MPLTFLGLPDEIQEKVFIILLSNTPANTTEYMLHLGGVVRRLNFAYGDYDSDYNNNATVTKLFAHIPNLLHIELSDDGYPVLLDALLTNHLPKLNYVGPPDYEGKATLDYGTCALLLKDRLKRLVITDFSKIAYESDVKIQEERFVHFHRLFDKLDYFVNLEELRIVKKPDNIIDLIEEITRKCPSIRKLKLELTPNDDDKPSILNVNDAIISNSIPKSRINNLRFSNSIINDTQLLQYIIYKFPQLENLELWEVRSTISTYLDKSTFSRLLEYLATIPKVMIIGIPYKEEHLIETIGSFWGALSSSCLLSIKFDFQTDQHCNTLEVEFDNKIKLNKCEYSHPSGSGLLLANIIEEHGPFIDFLTLFNVIPIDRIASQTVKTLFELLILDPLRYCTRLRDLSIHRCTLSRLGVQFYPIVGRQVLDSVKISMCIIEDILIFERLSSLIASVKYLEFSQISLAVEQSKYKYIPFSNINMKETNIGTLLLRTNVDHFNGNDSGKLLLVTIIQECYRYYTYTYSAGDECTFTRVSKAMFFEEQYNDEHFKIRIACKSLKRLELNHLNINIILTID